MGAAVTIHGIKACDTMKKAQTWLDAHGVGYDFHDYKKVGITAAKLQAWAGEVGWEVLLNKAGTTFRALPDSDKQGLDEAKAIGLMVAHTSLIKRPVLETDDGLIVGFKPEIYAARLAAG
jgi:arsenate reductase